MDIVLYAAGAGGDTVTATIDPRLYTWNKSSGRHLDVSNPRAFLRRRRLVDNMTDMDRNQALTNYAYNSIASHQLNYHVEHKHDFILIDSGDIDYATWAVSRFNKFYPNATIDTEYHVGFCTIAKEYTTRIIKLQDIIEGRLLKCLEHLTDNSLYSVFYDRWLLLNRL